MTLVEKVARRLAKLKGIEICSDAIYARSTFRDPAIAAITETLDAVAAQLSAVQYDPAPYTAMKARLAAMREELKP